jgi:hypothetical protein
MEPGPLVALVVDQDKVRGRQLVHQMEELSDVRATLATELGDAVIAMQEQHPPVRSRQRRARHRGSRVASEERSRGLRCGGFITGRHSSRVSPATTIFYFHKCQGPNRHASLPGRFSVRYATKEANLRVVKIVVYSSK